ncbi:SDR family oxidoreductase [Halobacteriaceae archaeon GCM10025711]
MDRYDPEAVLNCAAMTNVDGCEENSTLAHEINAEAPGHMARICAERDIEFVHVSTDYVFDGDAESPYNEAAEPNPIQEYGRSKLAGEKAVTEANDGALIARLSFVYGIHGATGELTGFPAWVRSQLIEDVEVPLFTDQHVTPTRAGHAAETILNLLEQEMPGLVHVASQSCVTPYEFGEKLIEHSSLQGSLIESTLSDVERPARRPRYSCLDTGRVESLLGRPEPTLAQDVERIASALAD